LHEGEFAGEGGKDQMGRAVENGSGVRNGSKPGGDCAAGDFEGEGLISGAKFDGNGGRGGFVVREVVAQGQREPVGGEGVATRRLGQEGSAPMAEGLEDGIEFKAAGSQLEESGGDGRRRVLAGDDAGVLEFAEAVGEEIGGDAGKAVAQVRVAAGAADEEFTDDEEGPAVANEVEGFGEGAELGIGAHGGIVGVVQA